MLKADLKPATRKWAIALIIINLSLMASPFIAYYQARAQLISDFIPKSAVIEVIGPYMLSGILYVATILIAFIFFVYSRFVYAIIAVGAGIVVAHLLPYFIY